MDSFQIAWRLMELAGVFSFPHLVAILLYFRLRGVSRRLAAIVAALAPAVLFFWLAPIYFFAGVREAAARGELGGCGMPGLAAAFFLYAGILIQLVLGIVTQMILARRR